MTQRGFRSVRAAFADAHARLVRVPPADPPSDQPRAGIGPGEWPGAPRDRLPPDCPVIPLGIDGKTCFFIDSIGQLIPVATSEWGKKVLLQLFCAVPNFIEWAWPRWSAPRRGGASTINGVEVDEACAALMKAASAKGLFDAAERVRGRGAWTDRHGRLIWHSGEALWRVDSHKLVAADPGELDGIFYPRRPNVLEPWQEPVSHDETPARQLLELLRTWQWERAALDPIIVLGAIAAMLIGGALPWRPHVAAMGDRGVGKSALQALIKGVLDDAVHDTGNTSAAGIYQRIGRDALPVAVDEFEASEDNRRVAAILELIRISSSGARMFRGGQDHSGVEFQARNSYFCSGINMPPMRPQDRSRFAILNLGRLQPSVNSPPIVGQAWGRMILRGLMDQWPDFPRAYGDWRSILRASGLDGRAQDTYGTLFCLAELLLGAPALEDMGLPITEAAALGELIASATAGERAEAVDNWRAALEHMLGATIDAWRGGERPSPGNLFEQLERGDIDLKYARERFAAAGLGVLEEGDNKTPPTERRYLLAVPASSPALARLYQGTRWSDGGWFGALKQGRPSRVVRDGTHTVKINRTTARCLLLDLRAYDLLEEPTP